MMGSNFQPKQKDAMKALLDDRYKYLLYGGAAGGGKSYFLRWAAIALGFYMYERYGVSADIGLFCEDYPTLKDRQITKIKSEVPPELGRLVETKDEGYMFEARYRAFKILLRNLDDPSKYASVEFAAIFVDELTKNPKETFEDLRFRLRYPGVPFPKFVAGTNPGSIGHGWVKKLWVQPDPRDPDKEQDKFIYIPSQVFDNKYIDESYVLQLESLPEQKRKAFLEGSWDIFSGQVFTEWGKQHVIEPFEIPKHWRRYRAFDPGYNNPFAIGWYAVDEDGHMYKYKELYMNGESFELKYGHPLTATRLAEVIKQIDIEDNDTEYDYMMAGPDLWNKDLSVNQNKDIATEGESAGETMIRAGIKLTKAPAGAGYRYNKLQRFHEVLADAPDGKPWLRVFRTCYDTIRTIPNLVYDQNKTEDVDTNGEDHIFDEMCMFLMSRPSMAQKAPEKQTLISQTYQKLKEAKERGNTGMGW